MNEFKAFALRGNVVDLAVGVVIGGAFGKIIASLVNDVLMPVLGLILGKVNITDLKIVIEPAAGDIPELAIRYGAFLMSMMDFLIIAFSVFIAIRFINRFMMKKKVEEESKPAEPPKEETLLTEIRDLLKERSL